MSENRIDALARLDIANINEEWKLLASWLPEEGEVSEVDGPTLVMEQWERTRQAYSNITTR